MGADMEIAVISFSRRGLALGQRLLAGLREKGWQAHAFAKCKSVENEFMQSCHPIEESIGEWTGKHFSKFDALIFVGACGIAVRSIAPYVKKKTTDPAVVVVDERGVFSISLLSGHIGGGNDLAQTAAEIIGAQPVVTTATDLNQVFAVDVFAKQNGCSISDMKYAKEISAQLLEGKTIGFSSDFSWKGELPAGLVPKGQGENPKLGIALTASLKERPFLHTLYLIPKVITVGIGCRKGTSVEKITKAVSEARARLQIPQEALVQAASIDLKKEEPGIIEYCRRQNLPYVTFSAEELRALEGEFTPSSFVKSVAGVDNVCERSALLASRGGRLILRKTAGDGVTVAFAIKEWSPAF